MIIELAKIIKGLFKIFEIPKQWLINCIQNSMMYVNEIFDELIDQFGNEFRFENNYGNNLTSLLSGYLVIRNKKERM